MPSSCALGVHLKRLSLALTLPRNSARKLLNMRLFSNAETSRAWDRSVMDESAELLCVSQVRWARAEAAARA